MTSHPETICSNQYRKEVRRRTRVYLAIIAAAYLLRLPYVFGLPGNVPLGVMRTLLHLTLFVLWARDLRRMIIQPQVLRSMLSIAGLMLFWTAAKGLKYYIFVNPAADRFLWYLYYAPLLLIPTIGLMTAFSMNRPSSYRLPAHVRALIIPAILLFILVITNDSHQLVFCFPGDSSNWSDLNYSRGVCYILVAVWPAICGLMFLVTVALRSRAAGSGRNIAKPLLPLLMIFVLLPLYLSNNDTLVLLAGDFSITFCILMIAVIESCIRYRFIPSNMQYEELFDATMDISAQITDKDYNVIYAARDAGSLPRETMAEAEGGPVALDNNIRFMNMPVRGGHMIWQEDNSELYDIRDRLSDTRYELQERNELLLLEYEREKQAASVREQNRLYSLLENSVKPQLDRINRLVEEYSRAVDAERNDILARIILIGTYVKRRKDLTLLSDSSDMLPASSLQLSVNESIRALERLNIKAALFFRPSCEELPSEMVLTAYDFMCDIIEAGLDSAHHFSIRMAPVHNVMRVSILTDASRQGMEPYLTELRIKYPGLCLDNDEDDEDGLAVILPLESKEVGA